MRVSLFYIESCSPSCFIQSSMILHCCICLDSDNNTGFSPSLYSSNNNCKFLFRPFHYSRVLDLHPPATAEKNTGGTNS